MSATKSVPMAASYSFPQNRTYSPLAAKNTASTAMKMRSFMTGAISRAASPCVNQKPGPRR